MSFSFENTTLEQRYEYYREIIRNYILMSDMFMRRVFVDKECTQVLLQVIMERNDLTVLDVRVQEDNKNLQGRSAILDIVAVDEQGKKYNVEVQQENEGASPKRARYHSGLLDMNTLNPGEKFEALPEAYVIFITRSDVLGRNLPIYHIERKIEETGEVFGDQSHIIYVNSSIHDETELGRLMHDFYCSNAADIHNRVLANRVRHLKETQEEVDAMCKAMEEIKESGEISGVKKNQRETALRMLARGYSIEEISEITGLSVDELNKLKH